MKKLLLILLFVSIPVFGQQTINKLITKELTVQDFINVTSTTKSSKPCPPMTLVQRDAITSPATGSCVYNTTDLQLNIYDGTAWQTAGGGGINNWETGKSYEVDEVVIESNKIYQCEVAHTSGTFATDLANGNWVEISAFVGVDLTTNQTVGGEKTFSDTVKLDSIQTTGSSGVQIKNSSGVNVADFGPAGTTNASIVGGLNVGVNLAVTGTASASNLSGTNTGDLTTGGDSDTPATTSTLVAPNKQLTLTGTNQYRLNTGNNNELDNPNFEHSTVGTSWTVSNATSSANTTTMFEGKKSLSLALTGALSLSQSSTINAARKVGVQMVASIFVKSDDVSDLQLCSLKNGAEDKCTVVGGYVQGSGWRQLTVSFLGDATSNGLKLKSTDTTGTVLVDQAYVGIGSPIVDFTPDMVYSATVEGASGSITRVNTSWLSSCTANGSSPFQLDCTISTGVFTVTPTCTVSHVTAFNDSQPSTIRMTNLSTTQIRVTQTFNGSPSAIGPVNIICQKQGADYKTSKAYVASGSDTDWASCGHTTSDFNGFGTVSNIETFCKRKGSELLMRGKFTSGASTSNEARINLKLSGTALTSQGVSTIPSLALVGKANTNLANTTRFSGATVLIEPSIAYITFGLEASSYVGITKYNGNDLVGTGNVVAFFASIPIAGWQDSSVIVGSFQGYNETPGTSRVETFSFSYGTTNATTACSASPCSYLDQIGNNVTSVTRGGNGSYTANFGKTYSKLKCSITATIPGTGAAIHDDIQSYNSSTISITTRNPSQTPTDTRGVVLCQATP